MFTLLVATSGMPALQTESTRSSSIDLKFGWATLAANESLQFVTRGYNGQVPGPTLRIVPGEALTITVHNELEQPYLVDMPDSAAEEYTIPFRYRLFNWSSFHLHGMHVSPQPGADDAFCTDEFLSSHACIAPGAARVHKYEVPANHMGGTHWYHPHVHGASAMHVGGGAMGMVIVDDVPGSLPPSVASLPERHVIFSDLRPRALSTLALTASQACEQAGGHAAHCSEPFWTDEAVQNVSFNTRVLVNGQLEPQLEELEAGQWYRFRLLYATMGGTVESGMPDHPTYENQTDSVYDESLGLINLIPHMPTCTMALLAKDGVYLNSAPRPVDFGYLMPGSRADLLVQCPAGEHGLFTRLGTWPVRDSTRKLFSIHAKESDAPPAPPIAPFSVRRPCYLADLTAAPSTSKHYTVYNISGIDPACLEDPDCFPAVEMNADGNISPPYNATWGALIELPVGRVIEMNVSADADHGDGHVIHMHVNPFQLQDGADETTKQIAGPNWFMKGDWHDTVQIGLPGTGDLAFRSFVVRFQTDSFTGSMMTHCHYLQHEDEGMIVFYNITGKEGTTYPAENIDPTCYRGTFPGTETGSTETALLPKA